MLRDRSKIEVDVVQCIPNVIIEDNCNLLLSFYFRKNITIEHGEKEKTEVAPLKAENLAVPFKSRVSEPNNVTNSPYRNSDR